MLIRYSWRHPRSLTPLAPGLSDEFIGQREAPLERGRNIPRAFFVVQRALQHSKHFPGHAAVVPGRLLLQPAVQFRR